MEQIQNPQPNIPQQPKWYLRHKFLWSLAGFLLLVVVAGSYFWWKEIKKSPFIPSMCPDGVTEECKKNLSLFESTVEIMSWKTYTNTEYGFELKYPNDWELKSTNSFLSIRSKIDYDNIVGEINYGPSDPINIQVHVNSKNSSVNDWFGAEYGKDEVFSKKLVKINNMDAIEANVAGIMSYNSTYLGSTDYILEFYTPADSLYLNTYNQILSTFRFLDYKVSTSGSLKTYINNKYGFEIKFPSEWPDPRTLIPEVGVWDTVYISDGTVADGCCFGVQIDVTTDKKSVDSFYSSANVDDPDVIAEKDITFAGQKAKEVVTDTHFGANQKMIYLLFENKLYLLRIADVDKSAEQVLFTFRFTK